MVEEEINLRYYITLLLKQWYWLAGAALLAAVAAFGLSSLRPAAYEATAAAAVVRSRTDISLDERIETLDDYQLGGGRQIEDRLAALRALAGSNEVMQSVLEDVGDRLAPDKRNLRSLRRMSSVELTGDMIAFSVRHAEPETAALIANILARAYVEHVNQVYGASEDNVENITVQAQIARERYDRSQHELESYLADERESTLSLTLERELGVKRALLDSYQQSRIAIETREATVSSELLSQYNREIVEIEAWLADAETLRAQVAANSGTFTARFGDTVAFLLLRGRVYGGDGPLEMQMDLANTGVNDIAVADVDNLIAALETRLETTRERIQRLAETVGSAEGGVVSQSNQPLMQRIETLTSEISALESQLTGELATRDADRRELEAARDRAWDTYQALTGQVVVAEIQAQSSNSEVRIADVALTPESPVGSGSLTNAILAATVAVMFAAGVVVFLDWWSAGKPADLAGGGVIRPAAGLAPNEPISARPRPEGQPGD
jgi:uncharacterized protein involved in exopolysaccharide biosynthesis